MLALKLRGQESNKTANLITSFMWQKALSVALYFAYYLHKIQYCNICIFSDNALNPN